MPGKSGQKSKRKQKKDDKPPIQQGRVTAPHNDATASQNTGNAGVPGSKVYERFEELGHWDLVKAGWARTRWVLAKLNELIRKLNETADTTVSDESTKERLEIQVKAARDFLEADSAPADKNKYIIEAKKRGLISGDVALAAENEMIAEKQAKIAEENEKIAKEQLETINKKKAEAAEQAKIAEKLADAIIANFKSQEVDLQAATDEQTVTAAKNAANEAETAAGNAKTAAGNAETAAGNAKTAAGNAETAAGNAKTAAETAATAAKKRKYKIVSAKTETAATAAETAAITAATAATTAATAATTAATVATAAKTAALFVATVFKAAKAAEHAEVAAKAAKDVATKTKKAVSATEGITTSNSVDEINAAKDRVVAAANAAVAAKDRIVAETAAAAAAAAAAAVNKAIPSTFKGGKYSVIVDVAKKADEAAKNAQSSVDTVDRALQQAQQAVNKMKQVLREKPEADKKRVAAAEQRIKDAEAAAKAAEAAAEQRIKDAEAAADQRVKDAEAAAAAQPASKSEGTEQAEEKAKGVGYLLARTAIGGLSLGMVTTAWQIFFKKVAARTALLSPMTMYLAAGGALIGLIYGLYNKQEPTAQPAQVGQSTAQPEEGTAETKQVGLVKSGAVGAVVGGVGGAAVTGIAQKFMQDTALFAVFQSTTVVWAGVVGAISCALISGVGAAIYNYTQKPAQAKETTAQPEEGTAETKQVGVVKSGAVGAVVGAAATGAARKFMQDIAFATAFQSSTVILAGAGCALFSGIVAAAYNHMQKPAQSAEEGADVEVIGA
jgi:hypothetical protein